MLAILSKPGDFAKITQGPYPLKYVTKLTGWCEDITGNAILQKDFRWGTTNRVRSAWVELNDTNLQQVILNPADDIFIDFRYTLISGGVVTINSVEATFTQTADAKDPYLGFVPPMTVSDKGNITNLTKIANFTFRPYAVNPAVVLYKELSYTINQMFGHDVLYARAVPMANGRDVVLHEWTLYDVDDPVCIKAIVDKNEFPDNKITFNPMGLDFEMPFEIQIVKEYYEQIFGIGTGPQKRDIVYFPLTNRIYEVESSYLFRGIMQQEVYWKIALMKYAPKSNRYEPQDLREHFTELTHDTTREFGEEVELETIQVTDPQQFDPKIGSREYDPTRLMISDALNIKQYNLNNFSNLLSETQYDLSSMYKPTLTNQPIAVEYRANVDFPENEDRSLSMWFKETKPVTPRYKDSLRGYINVGAAGSLVTPISFTIGPKRNYEIGSLLKITRFNGMSLYGTIVSITPITNGYTYVLAVKNDIIQYLNTYYTNWASSFTTSGYFVEATNEQILFNGWNTENNTGWKLSIFASRYFVLTDAHRECLYILNTSLVDEYWYALFLNISNFYRQATLDLWVRKWNDQSPQPEQTTQLENIYNNTISNVGPYDRSAAINYRLNAGNLSTTNLRLYDKIETESTKQILMLNQTIVKDSQYAIIIDNAIDRLKLSWIAKTK